MNRSTKLAQSGWCDDNRRPDQYGAGADVRLGDYSLTMHLLANCTLGFLSSCVSVLPVAGSVNHARSVGRDCRRRGSIPGPAREREQ
jgi:hypothetical protein